MQEENRSQSQIYRKKTQGPLVSLVASLEKNSKQWENNYFWGIDRTSNNHDDI